MVSVNWCREHVVTRSDNYHFFTFSRGPRKLTLLQRWGWGEVAGWGNHQAEPRGQGGNYGNPAQPTTRTPVTLIISGELHSIRTKGSGGRGNDCDRSAGNQSIMAAKRERMAQNVLSAVPWAWEHVIASNGHWQLTTDQQLTWHRLGVNYI